MGALPGIEEIVTEIQQNHVEINNRKFNSDNEQSRRSLYVSLVELVLYL